MSKLQRGFTLVEVLLVMLVIAAISFGEWQVWRIHHKVATQGSANSSTPITTYSTVPPRDWLEYINTKYGYSFWVPANWTVNIGPDAGGDQKIAINQSFDIYATSFKSIDQDYPFRVSVDLTPELIHGRVDETSLKKLISEGLESVAKASYSQNTKSIYNGSSLKKVKINNLEAYEYTVIRDFSYDYTQNTGSGELVSQPTKIIFTKIGNTIIRLASNSNDQTAQVILTTFKPI